MLYSLQKTKRFQQIAQFNSVSSQTPHYKSEREGQFAIIKLSDTLFAVYSNGPTSHSSLKRSAVCQMPHRTATGDAVEDQDGTGWIILSAPSF